MKKTNESSEDYLETIFVLSKRISTVRSIDIATELGYSKPSVSVAMKKLKKEGMISVDRAGFITLTPAGSEVAETIYERHDILSKCLIALGDSAETAFKDACRMEHVISSESFQLLKGYYFDHLLAKEV